MSNTTPVTLKPLLGSEDGPPFQVINPEAQTPLLLLCDHASNAVPQSLGTLGLPSKVLEETHIAWDIGAANLTCKLAKRLNARAILGGYSRLLIDCNRQPGDPSSIPEVSDGVIVPGNQNLNDAEAEQRLETFFWPFHHSITQELANLWRNGPPPAIVAVHSFTPIMMNNGETRAWHIGILWNHDPRMAIPTIRWLRADSNLLVGDNQPYSGREKGFTLDQHAGAAGLPHMCLEIRQDLIADEAGCERWAMILASALENLLEDSNLHSVMHF